MTIQMRQEKVIMTSKLSAQFKVEIVMTRKAKITVVRKFTPEDVFGPNHGIMYNGGEIPSCPLEVGSEFIVDSHLDRPKGFCGRSEKS